MKLTTSQLADILHASATLVETALDSSEGIRDLEMKQEYAVAYLTSALLSQITLPTNHQDSVTALNGFCATQDFIHREIQRYLLDPALAPDMTGSGTG